MRTSSLCSPTLLRALLELDTRDGWQARLYRAFRGLNPDDGLEASALFERWFSAGLAEHLPTTDLAVLELDFQAALNDVSPAAATGVRALVTRLEQAGESAPHRELLGKALLLLARRLDEDGDHPGACDAALRAEQLFAKLHEAAWEGEAMRARALAMICLDRLDEALALLAALDAERPRDAFLGGRHRIADTTDERLDAVKYLRSPDPYEQLHGLGILAKHHPGFRERYEAGLKRDTGGLHENFFRPGGPFV